jgi:hypothetical protein
MYQEFRMYHGFRVEVENITLLTEEQCQELHKKLAVLAVSTTALFDDPVQVTEHCMIAYYTQELYAQETVQHLCRYLQQIRMESTIKLTLRPAQFCVGRVRF